MPDPKDSIDLIPTQALLESLRRRYGHVVVIYEGRGGTGVDSQGMTRSACIGLCVLAACQQVVDFFTRGKRKDELPDSKG